MLDPPDEVSSESDEETKRPDTGYSFSYFVPSKSQYIFTKGKGGASMSKKYSLDFVCRDNECIVDAMILHPSVEIIVALTDRSRLHFISKATLDYLEKPTTHCDALFNNQSLLFSKPAPSLKDAVLFSRDLSRENSDTNQLLRFVFSHFAESGSLLAVQVFDQLVLLKLNLHSEMDVITGHFLSMLGYESQSFSSEEEETKKPPKKQGTSQLKREINKLDHFCSKTKNGFEYDREGTGDVLLENMYEELSTLLYDPCSDYLADPFLSF